MPRAGRERIIEAAPGVVDLFEAVHQRPALDRDATAHGVDARIGLSEPRLHVEFEQYPLARPPGAGQAQPTVPGRSSALVEHDALVRATVRARPRVLHRRAGAPM